MFANQSEQNNSVGRFFMYNFPYKFNESFRGVKKLLPFVFIKARAFILYDYESKDFIKEK
jgi:hypothetical protein